MQNILYIEKYICSPNGFGSSEFRESQREKVPYLITGYTLQRNMYKAYKDYFLITYQWKFWGLSLKQYLIFISSLLKSISVLRIKRWFVKRSAFLCNGGILPWRDTLYVLGQLKRVNKSNKNVKCVSLITSLQCEPERHILSLKDYCSKWSWLKHRICLSPWPKRYLETNIILWAYVWFFLSMIRNE